MTANTETKYDVKLKYTAELLRDLPKEELQELIEGARKTHHELRAQNADFKSVSGKCPSGGPIPSNVWKKLKRDIARMLTVLHER